MRGTDHKAPHYIVFSITSIFSCYLVNLRPKNPPQHPIPKYPQNCVVRNIHSECFLCVSLSQDMAAKPDAKCYAVPRSLSGELL